MNARERRYQGWLDAMIHDLLFAGRTLRRSPGFTVIAISSLALGLALAATTLAVVNAYLIRSLPYPTADRLFHLRYAPPGPIEPRGMNQIDWKALGDVVDDAIIASSETYYLADSGHAQTARGLRVTPGFIRGLGVRPAVGRVFDAPDYHPNSDLPVLIGYGLWRDRFGSDPNIVGRQFRANTEQQGGPTNMLRIVGVLPPGFWFGGASDARVDLLTPLRTPFRPYMVRLREGVSATVAAERITAMARSIGSEFPPNWPGIQLTPLHERYVAEIRPLLEGITLAVGFVLVLVCANVAVMVMLRAMRRQKEIAVRIALGAGTGHVARMLVAETGVICAVALTLGLTLTGLILRAIAPLIETELGKPAPAGPSAITLDFTVVLLVGGIGLLIALILSFIPLLSPWQRRLADSLRREGMRGTDAPAMRRLRASLIALELAGSLVLLVGCGLMIRSTINLVRTDLGYQTEHVVRARLVLPGRTYPDPPSRHGFFLRLLDRLSTEVNSPIALAGSFPPFYESHKQPLEADTGNSTGLSVGVNHVGAGHFEVLSTDIRQGREFTHADRLGSEPVAIVSETLARSLWPEGSAVGRRIRTGEQPIPGSPAGVWRTVVGVARDVRQIYADTDLTDVYLPFLQVPGRFASIEIRTDRRSSFWLAKLRSIVAELDPYAMVPEASTLSSQDRQLARAQFLSTMLTAFSSFVALLALMGVYGVTAYAVQQREREVAIRIALGASRSAVVRMFLQDGGLVVAAGVGLGLLGSLAATALLESQIYGVRRFDLWTIIVMGLVMTIAGLLAIGWPARRAADRNVMLVLKEG